MRQGTIKGRQRATFIFDYNKGGAVRRGRRNVIKTFNDLLWGFVGMNTRVAVTVQRDTKGEYRVFDDRGGVIYQAFALSVYRNGAFVGRICRQAYERLFGTFNADTARFKITKRVLA